MNNSKRLGGIFFSKWAVLSFTVMSRHSVGPVLPTRFRGMVASFAKQVHPGGNVGISIRKRSSS